MVNYKLQFDDYLSILEKETNLLIDLCKQFDNGNFDYANVISTKITSIINFKGKSESLLVNMNKQDIMKFCATSKILDDITNVLFYRSLVVYKFSNNTIVYSPKFNTGKYPTTWVNFDEWANAPVYILNLDPTDLKANGLVYIHEINKDSQQILSRKDIISFYRDKFVGAHADLKLNKLKYQIAINMASIEHLDHPQAKYQAGEKYIPGEPIKYMFEMAVRQIAHELILSIKNEFNFPLAYKPDIFKYFNKKPNSTTDVLIQIMKYNPDGTKELQTKEF